MKYLILGTAAAMLLSGTAMAGTAKQMRPTAATPVAAKDGDSLSDSMIGNAITIDWPAKRAEARAIDTKHIIAAAKAPSTAATSASADVGDDLTGVGGPEEPVETAAATAAASYPACRPGPGDDSCIQLYEPGVQQALASWEADHSGERLAMGGPEEPVDTLAAYEPLPEDAVMPASEDMAKVELTGNSADLPTAI